MVLPQAAIDGTISRRGRLHCFERIAPAKTALVVIDMHNAFLQEGAPAEIPVARDIVDNINRLAGALRRSGGTVVWVQMTHTADDLETWSFFYDAVSNRPARLSRLSTPRPGWRRNDRRPDHINSLWPDHALG